MNMVSFENKKSSQSNIQISSSNTGGDHCGYEDHPCELWGKNNCGKSGMCKWSQGQCVPTGKRFYDLSFR